MRFANILDIDVLNFKFEQTFSTNVKVFFLFQAVPKYLHSVTEITLTYTLTIKRLKHLTFRLYLYL